MSITYAALLVQLCCTFGIPMPDYRYTYAELSVYLCWTIGIPMLNYRYTYAEPSVPGCYTFLVPLFESLYNGQNKKHSGCCYSKYDSTQISGMFSIQSCSTYPFIDMRSPFKPGLSLTNCDSERARTFSSALTSIGIIRLPF